MSPSRYESLPDFTCRQVQEEVVPEHQSENSNNLTELNGSERECCRQNFQFYDKAKLGYVERFELPMVLNSKS